MPVPNKKPVLFIVGTPLSDEGILSHEAIECIQRSNLIIAESKKNTFRYLKQAQWNDKTPVFFLDNIRKQDEIELKQQIKKLSQVSGQIVLFSDTGMPLLFDPGTEILGFARELRFEVHSVPSATSWGSACALSGWGPPFLVHGFLARDASERKQQLTELKSASYHVVLMDTPYRFEALIGQVKEVLGEEREVFLAWEISKPQEKLWWGPVQSIQREAEKQGLKKGEFILIIRGLSRLK